MNRALLALGASLLLHGSLARISVGWDRPLSQPSPPLRLHLIRQAPPVPSASPRAEISSAPAPVSQPRPTGKRSAPSRQPKATLKSPLQRARSVSTPDNYPRARRRSTPKARSGARPTEESVGARGQSLLEPPVLIRGPETIAIPEFLRNRDGHFRLSLKCLIEPDGSSRIEVWDGTGCPELDENVRQSFSGRNWYPALLEGRPQRCTVRLTVESSWKPGESAIDWGGRVPKGDLARY